jgi:hypothetical protein
METTCAVCRLSDGLVINAIVASPSDPAPDGCELVEIMNNQLYNIGWYYANGVFNGPRNYAFCSETTNEVMFFATISYVTPNPSAPSGYYAIEVATGTPCSYGWTWDGSQFNPPVA